MCIHWNINFIVLLHSFLIWHSICQCRYQHAKFSRQKTVSIRRDRSYHRFINDYHSAASSSTWSLISKVSSLLTVIRNVRYLNEIICSIVFPFTPKLHRTGSFAAARILCFEVRTGLRWIREEPVNNIANRREIGNRYGQWKQEMGTKTVQETSRMPRIMTARPRREDTDGTMNLVTEHMYHNTACRRMPACVNDAGCGYTIRKHQTAR